MGKLLQLAICVKELLEDYHGIEARFELEKDCSWIPNFPDAKALGNYWDIVRRVYSALVDEKWELGSVLAGRTISFQPVGYARADIWFKEPYSFIVEFDEKQHFNQFRLRTLEHGYKLIKTGFDVTRYTELCKQNVIRPGKSGFTKLKSPDPLFPEMLEGYAQDNRTRQRAFRDYLKDVVPFALGMNPTIRIDYKITNGKIKDFQKEDIEAARNYFRMTRLLQQIELKEV